MWSAHRPGTSGQKTKQIPDSPALAAVRLSRKQSSAGEWLLLIQVCPRKALGMDRILFTLWVLVTNQKCYLLGWVLSLSLNQGPQA